MVFLWFSYGMCHIQIPSRNIVQRGRKVLHPSSWKGWRSGVKIAIAIDSFPTKKTVPNTIWWTNIAMENHHAINGKIHYFDWAMFNCYVSSPEGKATNKPWSLNMACWEIFHSYIWIYIYTHDCPIKKTTPLIGDCPSQTWLMTPEGISHQISYWISQYQPL